MVTTDYKSSKLAKKPKQDTPEPGDKHGMKAEDNEVPQQELCEAKEPVASVVHAMAWLGTGIGRCSQSTETFAALEDLPGEHSW